MPETTAEIFEHYRKLLFSIAYRMLSSATDAEDIVQEAFVRWLQVDDANVQSPKAYLSRIVVRLCIDHQRSAHVHREQYIGPWLPEPILTSQHPDLVETAMLAESLSFAFLIMLENLGPLERAVFLLRDVFDYDYDDIATIVGKSTANCRQVLHRAREHLGHRRPRFDVSHEQQDHITNQFGRASTNGDMQGLLSLLTDDIVFTGDGGGKARAGLKPVKGADKVARGMLGGLNLMPPGITGRVVVVNGQIGVVAELDGKLYGVVLLEFAGEQISR